MVEGGHTLDEERHGATDALDAADEPWEEGFGVASAEDSTIPY